MKPILFNTDMVRAILDGRKTETRRVIKPQPKSRLSYCFAGHGSLKWSYPSETAYQIWGEEYKLPDNLKEEEKRKLWNPPCHTDDILYVRETWSELKHAGGIHKRYVYKASDTYPFGEKYICKFSWKPSIHMPKEAARIFLRVTNVRVERLQEITEEQVYEEGFQFKPPCLSMVSADGHYCVLDGPCTSSIKYCDMSMGELFGKELWDSTIKKSDLETYGWNANPLVYVISFERITKDEALKGETE